MLAIFNDIPTFIVSLISFKHGISLFYSFAYDYFKQYACIFYS